MSDNSPQAPNEDRPPIKEYIMLLGGGLLVAATFFMIGSGVITLTAILWNNFVIPHLTQPIYIVSGTVLVGCGMAFVITTAIAMWRSEVSAWRYIFNWLPLSNMVMTPEQMPPEGLITESINHGGVLAELCLFIGVVALCTGATPPSEFNRASIIVGNALLFIFAMGIPLMIRFPRNTILNLFRLAYGTKNPT